jgi:methionyl-tRNA formyltransferase
MRIIFIGTVQFSKRALEKLISLGSNVVGIITSPDNGSNSDWCDLAKFSQANKLDCIQVNDINSKETLEWIRFKKPDIVFCLGWSRLIKKDLLSLPPKGIIGFHPALLPQNRGRHPIIWSILLGLSETGSTYFLMDEGADSGDIISQKKVIIEESDNAESLYEKICETGLSQLPEVLSKMSEDPIIKFKQDHSKANYWRKRTKQDGLIDWRMSSLSISRLVRGLSRPYPGAHTIFEKNEIKIWEVEICSEVSHNAEPGKILSVDKNRILIKTGDQGVWINRHEFKVIPKSGSYLG